MQRRKFPSDQVTADVMNVKYAADLKATAYYIIKDSNTENVIRNIGTVVHPIKKVPVGSAIVKKRGEQKIAPSNHIETFNVVPSGQLWSASPRSSFGSKNKISSDKSQKTNSTNCSQKQAATTKADDYEKSMKPKSRAETRNLTNFIHTRKVSDKEISTVQTKNSCTAIKLKMDTTYTKPGQKKVSVSNPSPNKVCPPPPNNNISFEVAHNTYNQRLELLKSLKQKGLPPLQPWKPGKIPSYNFTGRLKDLDELLENALLDSASCEGTTRSTIERCNREATNPRKRDSRILSTGKRDAGNATIGKSSIYSVLRCKDDDPSIRKIPRRFWMTWNFKTQWPMPL